MMVTSLPFTVTIKSSSVPVTVAFSLVENSTYTVWVNSVLLMSSSLSSTDTGSIMTILSLAQPSTMKVKGTSNARKCNNRFMDIVKR